MAVGHVRVGTGPRRVIALHGWFGAADQWGPFADLIDPARFSYAFLDCRGYGSRRTETGAYTMAEISADALALADALDWPRFSLVGHSMGGMAVQRVYADAPDRVDRLVGISPVSASGFPFDEDGWALFDGAAADPAKRRQIIDLTTGGRLSDYWLDQMVESSTRTSDPAAFGAYLTAWGRTDFADEIKGAAVPALAVAGEHDPALGPAWIADTWCQHYPQAASAVLTDAGHYGMFEAPVRLAGLLEQFLD
ncbi:esterase [Pilimelia terevasa]|uniref:Esterase n=1 Tax=Pilimelia terevasa TaxID=53372 RepID=A0A8J3FLX1_9ACTN|nr:alpha/beta hydrolase [Pilimelia terevasa]GGK39819.1 esterase [Pilimelia terevasa]